MKENIVLKKIVGKIPPGIISEDLKDNVTIESDVQPRSKIVKKSNRRELMKLPIHRIDEDQSQLLLEGSKNSLLVPALKFIKN